MNIKKRHITSCFPPSQGGLGWVFSCLFLMFFVVSACQDEIPNDTTEVMMTFTTRAFVEATQGDTVSTHLNEEKMKDLRVIMVRENGEIVGNHKEKGINQTSVTFTFRTPVKTGGEDFTFFAIANEESITAVNNEYWSRIEGSNFSTDELALFKALQIGNSAFTLSENQPIPQTKQWTIKVPQKDTKIDNQRLEYVASKISVEFHNKTNKSQTLKNIKLTGISTPTSGYLFKQDADDFLGTQQDASDIILVRDEGMTLATEAADSVKHYTYPVGTLSSPTLVATWEGVGEKTLALDGITALPRNQQLKIIVTLTGQELTVNYTIAPWTEHTTNIGGTSPTPEGGYDVKDWDSGNDVVIGEEQGGGSSGGEEPDEPEVPSGETKEVEVWNGSQIINWSGNNQYLAINLTWLDYAATVMGPNDISGVQMYVYYTGTGDMQVRKGVNENDQYGELYLNNNKNGYLGGLNGEKVSVFIPNEVKNTAFTFSGQNYTITKITVVKTTQ